ncbi:MAG: alpha/beta fold hydrolase [Hamadaea sp.]|nr:alpha/beta fold hydrolase [Hamadaea sp.]
MQLTIDRGTDRLAVTVYPAATADAPFFVLLPAMGVPARYYGPLVGALTAAGFGVAVADLRGTGASTPRPSRASRHGMSELTDDVAAVLNAVDDHRAGRKTFLLAHSLGGHAAVLHLARQGAEGVDGLILVACGLPHWRLFGAKGLGVLGFAETLRLVSAARGYWPGWAFGGRQSRGVIQDWAHTARRGEFAPRLGLNDRIGDLTLPVLAISVDDDQYTPRATTDLLVSKLTGARLTRHHLTVAEAGAPLDHFRWVKAPQAIVDRITAWLPATVRT